MKTCSTVTDAINLYSPYLDDTSSTQEVSNEMKGMLRADDHLKEREINESFEQVIRELVDECFEDDWDEYGSKAFVPASLRRSIEFFKALQSLGMNIMPNVVVESDGHIMFTWRSGKNIFSVIVQSDCWLIFSSIIGSERLNGTVPFINGKIPQVVIDKLSDIGVTAYGR